MSRSATSVLVFAIYLFALGGILVVAPNTLLAVFAFQLTSEVWIRVVGMLVLILGFYYLQAARHDLRPLILATVYGRTAVLMFFIAFVLLDLAPPVLIVFGAVDFAGAVWTALCRRADRRRGNP